jgi:hypothetical protein
MKKPRSPNVNDSPMAFASDGAVLLNVMHLDVGEDLQAALRLVLVARHEVFVGAVVPATLRRELEGDVDDALADVAGRLGPRLRTVRSGRRRAR